MRRLAATIVLAMTAAWPALAGQSGNAVDLSGPPAGLPRPADSGKAMFPIMPPASVGLDEAGRCLPALPCGSRLLGEVRKNGAVELRVPALRW
jgi:hypothetical protein